MTSIVFDAKNFYSKTGVQNYTERLITRIHEEEPSLNFIGISQSPYDFGELAKFCEFRFEKSALLQRLKPNIWLKFFAHRLLPVDSYFLANATFSPLQIPGSRIATVVHDLNHLYARSTMTFGNRIIFSLFFRRDIKRASYVVSNSNGTASKLLRHYGIRTDSIISPIMKSPISTSFNEEIAFLGKFGLKRYLLFVGTLEPRKNLAMLLEAYKMLCKTDHNLQLCLVGSKGWGKAHDHPGVGEVIMPGFVSDVELSILMRNTSCFVFPSIYEGYGMPVREALLHGAKVVCTDIPELREAGGEFAVYSECTPADFATAISRTINETTHRQVVFESRCSEEISGIASFLKCGHRETKISNFIP